MTLQIDQDLDFRGIAKVIVAYHPENRDAKERAMQEVEKYFTASDMSQTHALAQLIKKAPPPPVKHFRHLGVSLGTIDRAGLNALLAQRQLVARVMATPVLSLIRPVRRKPAALEEIAGTLTWGLEFLEVNKLWDVGIDGKGVLVGHLDTGVDGRHPALAGALSHYAVFDDLGQEQMPPPDPPQDTDEHGTHTAATIVGRPVGGKHVGVAPGAQLASATVIEGGDTVARVLGGMDWAIGNHARVLSMSLGIRGFVDSWLEVTRILRAQNVLPVFAVGNEGPGTSQSPGNYEEAFSIGAIDRNREIADFSSSQRFVRDKNANVPDAVSPGVDVISAKPGGEWQSLSGTSMATPHIAGLAALLFQAKPNATLDEVENAILQSCRGVPPLTAERAGRGFPNAHLALAALRG